MSGTLYGVGLGPGDPELMTLKAARLIGAARVVAYPALPGVESFARSIAALQLAEGVLELRLDVPMVRERGPAQAAYDRGAAEIAGKAGVGLESFLRELGWDSERIESVIDSEEFRSRQSAMRAGLMMDSVEG